jgi:serine/threonine-protein kinase
MTDYAGEIGTARADPSSAVSADAGQWQELQRLFHLCDRTAAAQRERTLTDACADPQLRKRVLAMVSAAEHIDAAAADPPEPTAGPPMDGTADPHAARLPLQHIGPYRLIRQVGAGGIGTVYLAERLVDGVRLRSALKLLAAHAVDPGFVERFHRETEHLAALDHPNITRLLDAGWTRTHQPYLVMEYVEGAHLDAYCDERQLGIEARLRLFLQVCAAVSNAHRNLILHLDLKPSNVLVSTLDTVKLLDFGTSKLIQSDGNLTSTIIATPAYASPEQILSQSVSTASDVYGLGAILFRLLAGSPPFGKTSAATRVEGAYRQVEPASVAAAITAAAPAACGLDAQRLRHLLAGDLEAIVGVCLRPRPRDRYASVDALAADVERYLRCEPVLARRQTLRYRAAKFMRRRRWPLAISGALFLTVAVSLMFAWSQQRHALHEAERSVRMQSFLYSLFKMANPTYTGKPVATVPEFLRIGMLKLPDYIHDAADLREAEIGLAESMFESGSLDDARAAFARIINSASAAGALNDLAEAEAYAGAVEFERGNIEAGRAFSAAALKVSADGSVSLRVRVLSQAYFAFNEENNGFRSDANLQLLRTAVQESRDGHLAARDQALALFYLASDLDLRGRGLEAKPIFQQLLQLYADDPLALCDRSEVYGWLAWLENTSGNMAGSLPLFQKAYQGYVQCAGPASRGALDELPYWADALIRLGRAPEAVRMLEEAMPAWRRVLNGSTDQSEMLYFLARGYIAMGRFAEAEQAADELLRLLTGKLAGEDRSIGTAHLVMGEALAGQQRYREAAPHAKIAVDLLVGSAVSSYARLLGEEAAHLDRQVQAKLR